MANSVEFKAAINRWKAERLGPGAKLIQQEFATSLGTRIVKRTPVLTGAARGNTRLVNGLRARASFSKSRRDPNGQSTINAITAAAGRLAAYSSFGIYNPAPYAPRLEKGWSRQAPRGMFRISLQELKADMSRVVKTAQQKLGKFYVQ